MTGDDVLDPAHRARAAARACRGRRRGRHRRRASGSRSARGSRRRRARRPSRTRTAIPSAVCPPAGCSSSSRVADVAAPGHGQRLHRAERERPRALDHELLVEGAQLALRLAGLEPAGARRCPRHSRAPRRGRRAARAGGPSRRASPAARWARGSRPARAARAAASSSSGSTRRVDHEGLAGRRDVPARRPLRLVEAASDDHAVDLQQRAGHERGRRGAGRSPARAQVTPRSLAASLRLLTSAVGFFWAESSVSLLRLTQITGTRCLTHGTTSW